jgi:chromosome segregation ATPase
MTDDTTITPEELDAMEQRANAATPGPWRVDANEVGTPWNIDTADGLKAVAMTSQLEPYITRQPQRTANAAFIAAARTDLPRLLAAYRALQAELADVTEQRNGYQDEILPKVLADANAERDTLQERFAALSEHYRQTCDEHNKAQAERTAEILRAERERDALQAEVTRLRELNTPAHNDWLSTEHRRWMAYAKAAQEERDAARADLKLAQATTAEYVRIAQEARAEAETHHNVAMIEAGRHAKTRAALGRALVLLQSFGHRLTDGCTCAPCALVREHGGGNG